jgi:sulfite reductase alpha subunit-like flavoprotein
MLDEGAVMYVCGNAVTMQAQLDAAFDSALMQVWEMWWWSISQLSSPAPAQARGLSAADCQKLRKEWTESKRLRREVWV